ncbi:MAG: gliding motility-associated C-terminal domain-containing protein, partial [Saprospiraceae bacterium]|nr:gliding motility-associated C-terminal domain-containing protein [Saprospiraceae bacterium]
TALLHVESTGNGQFFDGSDSEIILTGSDFRDRSNQLILTVDMLLGGQNSQNTNTTFRFSGPNPTFYVETSEISLEMGSLAFESPLGLGHIRERYDNTLVFDRVSFSNNGRFDSPVDFGELTLGPGRTYTFESGGNFSISSLTAVGDCSNPISMFASEAGILANMLYTGDGSGAINASFVSLKDISANANGTNVSFDVAEGVDLGNTTGWTIIPKTSDELFWVGGTGMWDDPANWSFTSGGAGGACVPTAGDDVVFDANSFRILGQVVMINVENAYCRGMRWEDQSLEPVLLGSSEKQIHIYGDLAFHPNLNYRFSGDLYFESVEAGATIATAGIQIEKDVVFRSASGGWILQDSLVTINDIYFQSGTLNTNDQLLGCYRFYSETIFPRTLELTNSIIRQSGRYGTFASFNATNLTLDAGLSRWQFLVTGSIFVTDMGALKFHWIELFSGGGLYNNTVDDGVFIDSLYSGLTTYFGRDIHIDYAELAPTQEHQLMSNDTLTIRTLVIPSDCGSGPAHIKSSILDEIAYLNALDDNVLENLIVEDVRSIGSGVMTDQNGVDLGNTEGWVFTNREPRTLYWVDGTGQWDDTTHWSLTSGGTGGQCVPTPLDNVIFDANSFTGAFDRVEAGDLLEHYCHDMTWDGVTGTPLFMLYSLNCFGSIQLSEDMTTGINRIKMRSDTAAEIISLFGNNVFNLKLDGLGEWTLASDLETSYLEFTSGTFNSAGEDVEVLDFSAYNANPKFLNFGGSHWIYTGKNANFNTFRFSFKSNITVTGEGGLLESTSTSPLLELLSPFTGEVDLLFSNLEGTSIINQNGQDAARFGAVEFKNDGIIYGSEMYMDTLILAAGKAYQLQGSGLFYINDYLQLIGNNCTPVQLSSTSQGVQSEIRMDGGIVKADFVQMRDQRAAGVDTDFLAGVHSTDIAGSNTGWIFESRREFENEGFLGEDKVLCSNQSVVLDANNASVGEQYLWNDGSTDSIFIIDQPGVFWAEVTFSNSCIIRDSVEVLAVDSFAPNLPSDTLLCEGQQILLEPSRELVGLTFLWQDGSEEPSILVSEEGTYKITLSLNDCIASDSVNIDFQTPPLVDLGQPRTLCFGDTLLLDAGGEGESYLWQDNSTGSQFEVTQAGIYGVTVIRQACTVSDSVVLDYFAPINLDLGPDTTVCENEIVIIDASLPGAQYRWQDGSTNAAFGAVDSGTYRVTVTINGCEETDDYVVNHLALPTFELGADTSICEDASIVFDGTVDANTTYQWNTGATTASETVGQAGIYSLTATRNGCVFSDNIELTLRRLPIIDIGPDQTVCAGETIMLDATFPNTTFVWQDGSTAASFLATQTGTYEVVGTLAGCSASDQAILTFNPLPVVELGADTLLCDTETLLLDVSVPNGAYNWQDGSTNATLSVNQAGNYYVEVTVAGCSAADTVDVIYPLFPADLLPEDQILCEGDIFPISLSVPDATYAWQDGNTSGNYSISSDGNYSVVASVGRCTQSDAFTVLFNPVPVFELGQDTIICEDQMISFSISAAADFYTWSTGQSERTISTNQPGQITATAELDNCSFTDFITLDVQQKSNLNLGLDTSFCEDLGYRLQVNVGGDRIIWQDGLTGPVYEVSESGNYSVRVEDRLCIMEDTILLTTRDCYRFQSYIPNAFSPDGMEGNSTFRPFFPSSLQVKSYQIEIVDRWGNLVFTANSPEVEWDGTKNGEVLAIGVYTYVILIAYQDDYRSDEEVIIGDVAIIR